MARILYGVHGSGHGHAVRALTVARHFAGHDFLFISFGSGSRILQSVSRVVELPGADTVYAAHRVHLRHTLRESIRLRRKWPAVLEDVRRLFDEFKPDVTLCDYEMAVPTVARERGIPCLSFDHQHIITCCRHHVPPAFRPEYDITAWVIRRLMSPAAEHLVTSFFPAPESPAPGYRVVPPLLRDSVLQRKPSRGNHVLAYRSHPTFPAFLPFLQTVPHPVVVYGFDRDGEEGNLQFRRREENAFLDALSSCRYVICGGGHTMISEALHFGKPVLSFPIRFAFEQFINAHYLAQLGYGMRHSGHHPSAALIRTFEARLPAFEENIARARFCGNEQVFSLIDEFIRSGSRTS